MYSRNCPSCNKNIDYKNMKDCENSEELKRLCQSCTNSKISTKYTKEYCKEIALSCKFKKDFYKNYRYIYNKCNKEGWIDEFCKHMPIIGSHFKRCIYVYEFSNNFVYIGLTCKIERRHIDHISGNGVVSKHAKKYSLIPVIKQITEFLPKEEASILEGKIKDSYQQKGWNILNIAKTGGLGGGVIRWTKKKCEMAIKDSSTRTEFYEKYSGAKGAIDRNGWGHLYMYMPEKQKVKEDTILKLKHNNKNMKSVVMFDGDMNPIKKFLSMREAERLTNLKRHTMKRGKAGGCYFKFIDIVFEEKENWKDYIKKRVYTI